MERVQRVKKDAPKGAGRSPEQSESIPVGTPRSTAGKAFLEIF
jgi:hypothetical protein